MNAITSATIARYKHAFGVPRDVSGFDLGGLQLSVSIFDDRPCDGACTLATTGLGEHVGQELLFSCLTDQFIPDAVKIIGWVARDLYNRGEGLREGEVLGPSGPILPHVRVEAFVAFRPVYFGDVFDDAVTSGDGGHVHVFWLVPLLAPEARWAAEHDAQEFSDVLEHQDPNLLDLCRDPMEFA